MENEEDTKTQTLIINSSGTTDCDNLNITTAAHGDKLRTSTNRINSVKRNLYFPIDTTIMEERRICVYQPSKRQKRLTVSEAYDIERNYFPKPSSSKGNDGGNHYIQNEIIEDPYPRYSSNSPDFLNVDEIIKSFNDIIIKPLNDAPTRGEILATLSEFDIPTNRFPQPFYSEFGDVTGKIDVGHNVLKIPSGSVVDLGDFESSVEYPGLDKWREGLLSVSKPKTNIRVVLSTRNPCVITPCFRPPTKNQVIDWIKMKTSANDQETPAPSRKTRIHVPLSPGNESMDETMTLSPCSPLDNTPTPKKSSNRDNLHRRALFQTLSQKTDEIQRLSNDDSVDVAKLLSETSRNNSYRISGATLDNTHGFKMSYENLQEAKAVSIVPHLTIMVVEIHTSARGDLSPDPDLDSVRAVFYTILYDSVNKTDKQLTGVIAVDTLPGSPNPKGPPRPPILDGTGLNCEITYAKSEFALFDDFVKLIRKWDPDIFAGYEIEMSSWGYLIQRAYILGVNLPMLISRLNPDIVKQKNIEPDDLHDLKIPGRIVLDIWRLLRHEIALQSYTFENIVYHVLHKRIALHSFKDLSFWWEHQSNNHRRITANYYIIRVEGVLNILDQLDLIGRTCELAKLFGIQFYEVLSRGSQFRVESLMLRLAKPQNYIPVSPSVQQRARMRAPEWLPLILEPESRLYVDPIIVLDFQSLYPSIIIAYNYCFSTCVGRVEKLGSSHAFEFGATQLKIPTTKLKRLVDDINFSPCGVGFVRPEVRKGVLPRMLQEILETRLMVKNSMKENKDDKILQRVLHSRQLGLKLIANVTYGYTAANFSGRMPCIEVGDSVVSKGRETLERAIKLIESNSVWNVRVVYGDTDSLFVLVPGRNRSEAFKIGEEIAEAVTSDNPSPVKLKLEKIYQPCILQTKKRYVGYMYESAEQTVPEYNAKGIETVRRDGCPAVAKILEKCLRMLFETCDISTIKKYVCRQFGKLLTGRASIQDLIFAREYRGASGYRPGACVPALELAKKWRTMDKRKEPRRSQRVPYIIVNGPPGLPLIKLVRSPSELMSDPALRPNALYYITKVIIPPVNRCFTLFGADLNIWFNEMPRKQPQLLPTDVELLRNKKSTISQYFATMSCAVCSNQTQKGLCEECLLKPQSTIVVLNSKIRNWEKCHAETNQICQSCCSRTDVFQCVSLDCPVLYRLSQTKRELNQAFFVRRLVGDF